MLALSRACACEGLLGRSVADTMWITVIKHTVCLVLALPLTRSAPGLGRILEPCLGNHRKAPVSSVYPCRFPRENFPRQTTQLQCWDQPIVFQIRPFFLGMTFSWHTGPILSHSSKKKRNYPILMDQIRRQLDSYRSNRWAIHELRQACGFAYGTSSTSTSKLQTVDCLS